jgi:hypothetical protein
MIFDRGRWVLFSSEPHPQQARCQPHDEPEDDSSDNGNSIHHDRHHQWKNDIILIDKANMTTSTNINLTVKIVMYPLHVAETQVKQVCDHVANTNITMHPKSPQQHQ